LRRSGYLETGEEGAAQEMASAATDQAKIASALSPRNVNILRSEANVFIKLGNIDSSYLLSALSTLQELVPLAPTDPKVIYHLGLTYGQIGEYQKAIELLQNTVELKSNYRSARQALALLYKEEGRIDEAREQLEYILNFIDKNDQYSKDALEEFKSFIRSR